MRGLLKQADDLRSFRNLFIHGNWLIDEAGLENGVVTCFDLRLQSRKGGAELARLKEHKFTLATLEGKATTVGRLVAECARIAQVLGSAAIKLEDKGG